MRYYSTSLKPNEFSTLLEDFANHAGTSESKYRCYQKMPYSSWVDIKHNIKGKCVYIDFDNWNGTITLTTNDGYDLQFSDKDRSFGSYLFDEFHWMMDADQSDCYYGSALNLLDDGSSVKAVAKSGETKSYVSYKEEFDSLKEDVAKMKETKKKEEEKVNMKGFNFDFGPCTNDNVKMSMYGLAVQNNAGVWVSYNAKSGELIDVDILNFDGRKFMFKMPVAIKDIAVGDIIVHNRIPMFVVDVANGIKAVDPRAGEKKEIIPTTNMFGFNFVTKVVSMFNAMGQAPTPDAPFGNMLPFMLLSEDNKDIDPMMLMLMMNGGNTTGFDMSNPMMLYFLMGKDGKAGNDMLPLMLMMQANQPKPHVCNCGGHTQD